MKIRLYVSKATASKAIPKEGVNAYFWLCGKMNPTAILCVPLDIEITIQPQLEITFNEQ